MLDLKIYCVFVKKNLNFVEFIVLFDDVFGFVSLRFNLKIKFVVVFFLQMVELKNLIVVMDIECCKEIVFCLLKEKVLVVDCQGVYFGVKGILIFLQIGIFKEEVYLFDVYYCDKFLLVVELKCVLEFEDIVKVGDYGILCI